MHKVDLMRSCTQRLDGKRKQLPLVFSMIRNEGDLYPINGDRELFMVLLLVAGIQPAIIPGSDLTASVGMSHHTCDVEDALFWFSQLDGVGCRGGAAIPKEIEA